MAKLANAQDLKSCSRKEIPGSNPGRSTLTSKQIQYFESKIVVCPVTKCHEWVGYIDNSGYGRVQFSGIKLKATHVAWYIATGHWPSKWMLHHCDNPRCVNFNHLYEGDALDNAKDLLERNKNTGGLKPISEDIRNQIRSLYPIYNMPELAKKFNISKSTVFNILRKYN